MNHSAYDFCHGDSHKVGIGSGLTMPGRGFSGPFFVKVQDPRVRRCAGARSPRVCEVVKYTVKLSSLSHSVVLPTENRIKPQGPVVYSGRWVL